MTGPEIIGGFPILSTLIFLPAVGALFIVLFLKKEWDILIKWVALGFAFVEFLLSLYLPFTFDINNPGLQWVEKTIWIKRFGISYYLGVDGISLLLVLLTTLITFICVIASWTDITKKLKGYMAMFLLTETFSLGVFMAMDMFLFYIFWEAVLIPMVFIIGIWGGDRKLYSAIKFFLFTFVGSLFMLLGILALYFFHGKLTGVYTFDSTILSQTMVAPAIQLGAYGFVRFSLPLLPNASIQLGPVMAGIAIFAILYGALVTIAQKDIKKLIAYSSVSHMGFVMLGIFVFNIEGLKGGLLQMINHGISTGALFLLVGMIYERTHTRMIGDYTGLFKELPVYGAFFLIIVLSSMGMPGTNGFIGELFVLLGAFKANWYYAVLVVMGVLFGAVYLLWLFQRVFLGNYYYGGKGPLLDLSFREIIVALPLLIMVFWIGLFPRPFLRVMDASLNNLVKQVEINYKKGSGEVPANAATTMFESAGERTGR